MTRCPLARHAVECGINRLAVLDEGGYEIARRYTTRNEHEVTTSSSINDFARDLTLWTAARDFPGRPTRQISEF